MANNKFKMQGYPCNMSQLNRNNIKPAKCNRHAKLLFCRNQRWTLKSKWQPQKFNYHCKG